MPQLSKSASTAIDTGRTSIPNARKSIEQKIKDARSYDYILAPYLKTRYAQVRYLIDQYSRDLITYENIQSLLKQDLTDANSKASKLYDSLKDVKDPDQDVSTIKDFHLADYDALSDQIKNFEIDDKGKPTNIKNGQYAVAMSKCAKIVQEASTLPGKLPQKVDPPIDSVLHSVTFVISYGANVTPSWTLLQWKGPGQSANFASASGVRTHNLVISMGPRSGSPAIGADPIRLIELQAIRSINRQ